LRWYCKDYRYWELSSAKPATKRIGVSALIVDYISQKSEKTKIAWVYGIIGQSSLFTQTQGVLSCPQLNLFWYKRRFRQKPAKTHIYKSDKEFDEGKTRYRFVYPDI
jgi:hypothetical protein